MRAALVIPIILAMTAFYLDNHGSDSFFRDPNSMALAPDTALNMLYDANLSNFSLKPRLTYWVAGDCPDCRVLRLEGIVEMKNQTYLAFFDLENKSVKLVPANETQVKEYLQFFEEHGGKVFRYNSTIKGTVGNRTFLTNNSICLVPAVVKVGN
ncbi:hypothetical protein [Thermococcus sp.]